MNRLTALASLVLVLLFSVLNLVSAGSNEESKKWLEENALKDDIVVLPSGLQYKILRSGEGSEHPDIDTPCECHYAGRGIDDTEFDSSYARGNPTSFAPNQVINGWTEAMQMMVKGDKWELYVPSDLGYGDRGSPPKIQGGDALIFVLELIEIKFECNPVSLKGCNEAEKSYVAVARKQFGSDPDYIEEGINELEETMSKLSDDKSRDLLESKLQILRAIFRLFGGRDDEDRYDEF